MSGPFGQQWNTPSQPQTPPQVLAVLSLPFSLCVCCRVLPLSLGLLFTGSSFPPLASGDWEGRRAFFLLNKDFLIDTLTWPMVFGERFQRQLLGSLLSPVHPDTAIHSQELDHKQGLLCVFFSVTSFHNLWAPGLGWILTPPLTPPFPVTLMSVPHRICSAPSDPNNWSAFWQRPTPLFWGL